MNVIIKFHVKIFFILNDKPMKKVDIIPKILNVPYKVRKRVITIR